MQILCTPTSITRKLWWNLEKSLTPHRNAWKLCPNLEWSLLTWTLLALHVAPRAAIVQSSFKTAIASHDTRYLFITTTITPYLNSFSCIVTCSTFIVLHSFPHCHGLFPFIEVFYLPKTLSPRPAPIPCAVPLVPTPVDVRVFPPKGLRTHQGLQQQHCWKIVMVMALVTGMQVGLVQYEH